MRRLRSYRPLAPGQLRRKLPPPSTRCARLRMEHAVHVTDAGADDLTRGRSALSLCSTCVRKDLSTLVASCVRARAPESVGLLLPCSLATRMAQLLPQKTIRNLLAAEV